MNESLARGTAPPKRCEATSASLLAWYDRHRRRMPWRALPGEVSDPYRVWLSEVMLQQTTVKAVVPYFESFVARWPDVTALAEAPVDEVMQAWAGLGYYSRARNLHACAKMVAHDHAGRFPDTVEGLRALPGIGAYTAAAIASIAFNRPAAVVDGNVERVVTRLDAIASPLPQAKPLIQARVERLLDPARPGDFAQATMDLGATICTPKTPACGLCPWREPCRARAEGSVEAFPVKVKKAAGTLRRGVAFVVLRGGQEVLVRTRIAKGLLGGMTEVPGSDWAADLDPDEALEAIPLSATYEPVPGTVSHVFTHFPLELTVMRAIVGAHIEAPEGMRFVPLAAIESEALPQLFRKVIAHALGEAVQKGPARAAR